MDEFGGGLVNDDEIRVLDELNQQQQLADGEPEHHDHPRQHLEEDQHEDIGDDEALLELQDDVTQNGDQEADLHPMNFLELVMGEDDDPLVILGRAMLAGVAPEEDEQEEEEEEDDDDDDPDDPDFDVGGGDGRPSYRDMLDKLSEDWLTAEIDHRMSKKGSEILWKLANEHFYEIYRVKKEQGIKRKIPQFQQIRRQLTKKNTPKVKLEIAYKCKDTGEITIMENLESTPVSRFPPSTHERLYEIASVDVSLYDEKERETKIFNSD